VNERRIKKKGIRQARRMRCHVSRAARHLLLFQLVVAIGVDPLLGSGGGEAVAGAFEVLEDLLHRDMLL
jgi:hypothetical protein